MNYDFLIKQNIVSPEELDRALNLIRQNRPTIGELAKQRGLIKSRDILRVLQLQNSTGRPFGEIAVDLGYLTLDQVDSIIEEQESKSLTLIDALTMMNSPNIENVKNILKKGVVP